MYKVLRTEQVSKGRPYHLYVLGTSEFAVPVAVLDVEQKHALVRAFLERSVAAVRQSVNLRRVFLSRGDQFS